MKPRGFLFKIKITLKADYLFFLDLFCDILRGNYQNDTAQNKKTIKPPLNT